MKTKHARQIRQGILQARERRPQAPLTDLAYKAFRRENGRRMARLMQRLSVLQVESELKVVMLEAVESIMNEGRS